MCSVLLPPGVDLIAVNKYININVTDVKQRSYSDMLATCLRRNRKGIYKELLYINLSENFNF
jgi:hypothetical protein